MKIGLDFDNTLVSYDSLFWELAQVKHQLPDSVSPHKQAIRDYLRQMDREEDWIHLQGEVYGAQIKRALAFEGVGDFIAWALNKAYSLFIISHKTRTPVRGPAHDLHAAAWSWLQLQNWGLKREQVFFELTQEEKRDRIVSLNLDFFVDDLPEFLNLEGFPKSLQRMLFDPAQLKPVGPWRNFHTWSEFRPH
jgi:hypothetical protein